jgi:dephospho-CoA kinase
MQAQPHIRVFGLTGGIASGKSTIGRMFRALGAMVIDADEVARAVVEPGRPAYEKIVATFGADILKPADALHPDAPRPIDRERLAARVFADAAARKTLNAITHPEIAAESARRIQDFAAATQGRGVAIYEATLLVENQSYLGLDGLIVVDVPEEVQLERAVMRGMDRAQAEARMRAQAGRSERQAAANWLIDNQGSEEATRHTVEAIWREIERGVVPPRRGQGG